MASYRQYRHQSSSDFGRPQSWSFEMDPYARYELSSLPVVGDFMRAMDQKKYWNDYMAATGLGTMSSILLCSVDSVLLVPPSILVRPLWVLPSAATS